MASIALSRSVTPPRAAAAAAASIDRHRIAKWYLAGALIAFAISFVGVSMLGLHHDLYLLVYFTVAGTFLASFVAHTNVDWRGWLRTRLWWSLGVGTLVAFAIVRNVMNQASMAHPAGAYFWFEIVWRGVLYGTADALMLFVFPAAIAYLLVRDSERRRKLRFAAVTLLLSLGITATYHLGYPQFRGTDLVQPEIGAMVAWVPTALTGNPIGAIVVHDSYHVAANIHTYRSAIYLPPKLDGYTERGSGSAGPGLAALWAAFAGTLIFLERRRLFPTAER